MYFLEWKLFNIDSNFSEVSWGIYGEIYLSLQLRNCCPLILKVAVNTKSTLVKAMTAQIGDKPLLETMTTQHLSPILNEYFRCDVSKPKDTWGANW